MAVATEALKAIRDVIRKAWRSILILLLLVGVGSALIAMRAFAIYYSHSIARHAHTYAEIFTVLFSAVEFLVTIIVGALVDTLGVVASVIDKLGGHIHFNPNKPKFTPVVISTQQIEALFNNLPARCEKYDNVGSVIVKATRGWLHNDICPIIRATWPIPWLWDVTNAVLGWASYDATPDGAWVPGGDPGNCERPDSTDWFCAGLGTGFVMVELLVPIVLVVVLSPLVNPVIGVVEGVVEGEPKPTKEEAPTPTNSNMLF